MIQIIVKKADREIMIVGVLLDRAKAVLGDERRTEGSIVKCR
jgi:hypothetical protein